MDRTRREKVREILISKPFTALSELEEKFPEVSSMTLRRDIEYFEEKGDVIKVRGGARAMHFITLTLEDTYYKRSLEASHDKERIAAAALRYIETGRSIFFDSGTTVMQLVPKLPDEKLTISTSDPNIALALVKKEHAVINVIGGSLNRSNLSLSGQMALQFVESTNIDVAFLSPSGFSLTLSSGTYTANGIDHMLVRGLGSSKVMTFGHILPDFYYTLSDHFPVYIDVQLN